MDALRFYVFSTVFRSYQDNGMVLMKSCVQRNPVYDWKDLNLQQESNLGPLDQPASILPTELPGLYPAEAI